MKYGYFFYRKPLRPEIRERPVNLGDPIQALAAINLFHEMGVPDESIIPIDRYDTANYDGEEVILSANTINAYEHICYPSHFLPFANRIKPVVISFHLNRKMNDEEITYLRGHGPIGCRDERTMLFMREHGIEAYLSGCLTVTFPRRVENENQNKVFLVDCPNKLLKLIPQEFVQDAITLTQVIRINSNSNDNRITKEEAEDYHSAAYKQLYRLRDEARLVITGRLHIAAPCLAMGIPVVLAKEVFDIRFGFIDKYLPLYTREHWHEIDWNPSAQNIENEKTLIKECFFAQVRAVAARTEVSAMYENRHSQIPYLPSYSVDIVLSKLPLPKDKPFKYAIWGGCCEASIQLHNQIVNTFEKAALVNMIDTYASGKILDVDIIRPSEISNLAEDVIVFVTPPAVYKAAKELLENTKRPFVFNNLNVEWHNFVSL